MASEAKRLARECIEAGHGGSRSRQDPGAWRPWSPMWARSVAGVHDSCSRAPRLAFVRGGGARGTALLDGLTARCVPQSSARLPDACGRALLERSVRSSSAHASRARSRYSTRRVSRARGRVRFDDAILQQELEMATLVGSLLVLVRRAVAQALRAVTLSSSMHLLGQRRVPAAANGIATPLRRGRRLDGTRAWSPRRGARAQSSVR